MIRSIAIDDEPLALSVIETLTKKIEGINLLRTFTQPSEALKYLRKFPVDLIFCDIKMPSMTGIDLVRVLNQSTLVVFTTAYSEYAAVSYELNALEYLVKPISLKRFTQAVNKAKDYFDNINNKGHDRPQSIYVRSEFSLVKILTDEIEYIEGMADYLAIHIRGRKPVVARMAMKNMTEKLDPLRFVRVHRSFILPFDKIESVRGHSIFVNGKEFPIGRTYMEAFIKRYQSQGS